MSEQDLIVVPAETALVVFTEAGAIDPYLAKIRAEIDAFVPDVSTKKGRDEIASMAYKVARSKTYLDGVGKELVDQYKELPKKIDASRKVVRDTLDAWKDEVRSPLTDWENAEAARVAKHKAGIEALQAMSVSGAPAESILELINGVKAIAVDATWEEFEAEANRVKAATLESYQTAYEGRKAYEAEQAELARLRAEAAAREQAEREARIAKEAEDRAKAQAEEAAKAERAAAERRELELRLQAEKAEREKLEAEQRAANAAKEAEARLRREAEDRAAKEAAEIAAREADKKHKASVNRAAAAALVKAGLSEDQAKIAITAIAKGEVPNAQIRY